MFFFKAQLSWGEIVDPMGFAYKINSLEGRTSLAVFWHGDCGWRG